MDNALKIIDIILYISRILIYFGVSIVGLFYPETIHTNTIIVLCTIVLVLYITDNK